MYPQRSLHYIQWRLRNGEHTSGTHVPGSSCVQDLRAANDALASELLRIRGSTDEVRSLTEKWASCHSVTPAGTRCTQLRTVPSPCADHRVPENGQQQDGAGAEDRAGKTGTCDSTRLGFCSPRTEQGLVPSTGETLLHSPVHLTQKLVTERLTEELRGRAELEAAHQAKVADMEAAQQARLKEITKR